ncbi:MAG TPA: hypothetical protein VHG92_02100 [Afifellaceae bacterium]|nr:hypothetical protein [Afifellaceae bacterium]
MTGPEQNPSKDAAQAIAVEASRLQRLALEHKYHFLAYLLEMALLEAWREASGEANGKCETLAPVDADPQGLKD